MLPTGSPVSLPLLHQLADEPFRGSVSPGKVADRIQAGDLGDSPDLMRHAFARLLLGEAADARPPVGSAMTLGGIDGLLVPPRFDDAYDGAADHMPSLVWFHGGGYVFGSPETHWRVGAAMATLTAMTVFLPRYRLAPEHPWPAQLDDALPVVRALQGDGRRVVLAGDSAGGHLALTTALALARERRPVAAMLLCSPNTDRSGLNTTRDANSACDVMNDDAQDTALARLAFGDMPPDDRQVSPLLDELSLLPPTCIEVGDNEVLRDDALLLARRGQAAGASIDCHVEHDLFHMWQLWTPWLEPANTSLARLAAFARNQVH